MQTLETFKRRIKTADDLQSVVRTMKTLAAVSIRQYEMAVESLNNYAETIELGTKMLLWNLPDTALLSPPVMNEGTGIVVFGSDQGMCGQFNEQIAAYALDTVDATPEFQRHTYFLSVGVRPSGRLIDAGCNVDEIFALPGSVSGITSVVQELLPRIDAWSNHRHLGRIMLFYNRRLKETTSRPHHTQLLPLDRERLLAMKLQTWPSRSLPKITMEPQRLFQAIIRQYLFMGLFRAFAESLASENASRIASMQAAERNIEDRLSELRLGYQQMRQTSITEELLDVVTGFEALMNP